MSQRLPDFPNFNPDFCGMVARYAAITCAAIVVTEVGLLLIGGDRSALCAQPSGSAREHAELSITAMIFMFSLPAAAAMIYNALRWGAFSRQITARLEMYMRQARDDPTMELHFGLTPLTVRYFPVNAVMTIAVVGFVLFSALPLLVLFGGCL
jgi:hypothetical protein